MLTEDRIDDLAREMVKGHKSMNWLASKIGAEVRKEDEALIRQMLEALDAYQGFIDDAHIIEGQWHWLDDAKPAITAARARLLDSDLSHLTERGKATGVCGLCVFAQSL